MAVIGEYDVTWDKGRTESWAMQVRLSDLKPEEKLKVMQVAIRDVEAFHSSRMVTPAAKSGYWTNLNVLRERARMLGVKGAKFADDARRSLRCWETKGMVLAAVEDMLRDFEGQQSLAKSWKPEQAALLMEFLRAKATEFAARPNIPDQDQTAWRKHAHYEQKDTSHTARLLALEPNLQKIRTMFAGKASLGGFRARSEELSFDRKKLIELAYKKDGVIAMDAAVGAAVSGSASAVQGSGIAEAEAQGELFTGARGKVQHHGTAAVGGTQVLKTDATAEVTAGFRATGSGKAAARWNDERMGSLEASLMGDILLGVEVRASLGIDLLGLLEASAEGDARAGAWTRGTAEVAFTTRGTGQKIYLSGEAMLGAKVTGKASATLKWKGKTSSFPLVTFGAKASAHGGVGAAASLGFFSDAVGEQFSVDVGAVLGGGASGGFSVAVNTMGFEIMTYSILYRCALPLLIPSMKKEFVQAADTNELQIHLDRTRDHIQYLRDGAMSHANSYRKLMTRPEPVTGRKGPGLASMLTGGYEAGRH